MKKSVLLAGIATAVFHPVFAVDYVVTGAATTTNGPGSPVMVPGDTLTVDASGSITTGGPGQLGIHFMNAGQNTIINNGQVNTAGNTAFGIYNRSSGNAVIVNSGQISTTGVTAYGIRSSYSGNAVINNSGQISTANNDSFGIFSENSDDVVINNSGLVSTSGVSAYGVINYFSVDTVINNSGQVNTAGANAYGIYSRYSDNVEINNSGQINTIGTDAYGIYNRQSSNTVIGNSGQLGTTGDFAYGIYNIDSDNVVINNSGQLNTADYSAYGIFSEDSNNLVVDNSGQLSTTGDFAYGIYSYDSNNTLIANSGLVGTSGVGANGIRNQNTAASVIDNSGQINTAGQSAFGISNHNSDDVVINNGGQIITTGLYAYGILNSASDNAVIINNGDVSTTNQLGVGIQNFDSNNAMIANNGQINTIGQNAYGIYNRSSDNAVIANSGQISTTGTDANGIYNEDSINAVINNSGEVVTTGQNAHGFLNENSTNVMLYNSGTIRVGAANAFGVSSDSAIGITNAGLIFAASETATAISLSTSGTDSLTLSAGSRIQGLMNLGGGDDTVTLDHNGQDIAWRWTFENFDPATVGDTLVVNGAPFVVETPGDSGGSGVTVTVADLSSQVSAGAVLADVSGAIRGAVAGRIAQAWALSDAGINTGAALLDEQGEELGWNGWAKAFGGYQSRSAQGLSGRTAHRYGGIVIGADSAPSDNMLLGAFGSYAYSSLAFDDKSLNNSGAKNIETNALFAGVYGRIESALGQNGAGVFADGTLTLGYGDGDAGTRLRANNLVAGGIEEITGGDASGAFADTSLTVGANVPVGASGAVLIPSATFGYATQWRQGYSEDSTVDGAMDVEGHQVSVLSAHLQLSAQIAGATASGMTWTAALRGGLNAQKDISEDVSFTMLATALSAQAAEDEVKIGGVAGASFTFAQSDILAFTLDSELTFTGSRSSQIGGTLNAGLRARF